MEELVNLVVKKTGLPKETAQTVVKIVLDFLKKKLPPAVGTAIDAFLNGGQAEAAMEMFGSMLNVAQKTAKKK
jgi:phage FluMu gp28-like protein